MEPAVIILACLVLIPGLVIIFDDGKWDRKK
jgi:hypothetical protein